MSESYGRVRYQIVTYERAVPGERESVVSTLDSGYDEQKAEWELGRALSENKPEAGKWIRLEKTLEFLFRGEPPTRLVLNGSPFTAWVQKIQCGKSPKCVLNDDHLGKCVKG